jgi:hypothetical protein
MNHKLDDLLGDANDDQLVLNDDYMHQLESMGKIASKQRSDALLSTVQVSKGVARAGIRAIKQAIASELQKISAKRRNLDTKEITNIDKESNEITETKSTSKQKDIKEQIEESFVTNSSPMSNLARDYSELLLRIRALEPQDVLIYVMKKHKFVLSSDALLAQIQTSPEGYSKKRSREQQTLDQSSELELIFSNKMYLQWEKSLIRWVRAAMHTNAKALKQDTVQIEENESMTTFANNVNIEKEDDDDIDDKVNDKVNDEDEDSTTQSLPQTLSSTIKPSNRQLKREQRELLKRTKMHIHGRGAGFGRGLSKSGEPTFEDMHPSWRLKKILNAKQAKLVEKSLKKKVV